MIHEKLTVSPLAVARTNEKWWYGLTRWPFVAERLNNFFSSGISSWNTEALRVVVSSSPRLLTELTLWMLFLHVIFCLEKKTKKPCFEYCIPIFSHTCRSTDHSRLCGLTGCSSLRCISDIPVAFSPLQNCNLLIDCASFSWCWLLSHLLCGGFGCSSLH